MLKKLLQRENPASWVRMDSSNFINLALKNGSEAAAPHHTSQDMDTQNIG